MHEGNTLKAAMLSVRQDTLFWTREVYEKIKTFSRGRPPTRTSMDYAPPQARTSPRARGSPGASLETKGKVSPPSRTIRRPGAVTSRQPPTRKGTSSVTRALPGQLRPHPQVQPHPGNGPHLPGGPPPAGRPGLTRGADPNLLEGLRCRGPEGAQTPQAGT